MGREVCLREKKKKRNDKKEKGMKELVRKADQKKKKKKDKTVGIFLLSEILSGKRAYVSPKRCYMTIRWIVGTFPLTEILSR